MSKSLDDKLFVNRYKAYKETHLKITDESKCLNCKDKPCTYICPAQVYAWSDLEQKILTAYEGCLECGTCRYGCTYKVIDWQNPKGGYGVQYKFG